MNDIRWWCSAQTGQPWTWAFQAYPGVWLFMLAILCAYVWALRRAGPGRVSPGAPVARPSQLMAFSLGWGALWVLLDWPVGPLAAGYLLTAHMIQYLLISLVLAPLLDSAMPTWMFRALCEDRPRLGLRWLVHRPLVAFLLLNATMLATHLPALADRLKPLQFGSLAIDLAWIASSMVFWWSIRTDGESQPRAGLYGKRLLYVAGIKMLPIFVGAFFVLAEFPLFRTYEFATRATPLSAIDDQVLAGLVMWMGTTPILIYRLASAWFSWYEFESRRSGDPANLST